MLQLSPINGGLTLTTYRGGLALTGPSLNAASVHFPHKSRVSHPLHITLLSALEWKSVGRPSPNAIHISLDHIYLLGLASSSRNGRKTEWIVIVWNHADQWRASVGLGRKAYHLTLTEEDDHEVNKGIGSLLAGITREELVERVCGLGEDGLDHTIVAAREDRALQIELAERLLLQYPESYKGYVRLADSAPHPKISALALAQAVALNPSLLSTVSKRLRKLRDAVSWGPMVTGSELEAISSERRPFLLRPWPVELEESSTLWTAQVFSRDRMLYLGAYELPRFFSWLYPGRLAGMSTPRNEADIDILREMGSTHVLSLTEETPLNESWFTFKVKHVFIPIRNYGAPTLAEMDRVYEGVREGGTWLVHCGGGVGRAGTVLACLIAMFGRQEEQQETPTPRLDAKTAISLLRQARPRSLESEVQERFVASWVSHRWKVGHKASRIDEPCTLLRELGIRPYPPDAIFFLIGKPGSGKSWFASAIAKRRPAGKTVVISQDDGGSRAACERQLARSAQPDTMIILDRCNPLVVDRRDWLKLVNAPCIAVFFDYPGDLCQQRIDSRIDHPTLRAGRGGNALAQFEKQMQAPSLEEGFAAVLTITSLSAARDAVQRITGDPPLLKFPRTAHLLDLGAPSDDDIVLESFTKLTGNLTIEEKVDGANLGISLDWNGVIRVQNRSHWISSAEHAQFRQLDAWIREHDAGIRRLLERDPQFPERYILYGEWMVAKHSIHYTSLPAPFLAFDLFDRLDGTFLSRSVLSSALRGTGIRQVPLITETVSITKVEILRLLETISAFSSSRIEGIYVRTEDPQRKLTVNRGKVVRGDFIAGNEHWSRGPLVLNGMTRTGAG